MDKFKELNLKIEKPKNKRSTNNDNKIPNNIKNEDIMKYILLMIENIEYLINNNYIENDEYQTRLKQIENIYVANVKISIKDKINEIKKILKNISFKNISTIIDFFVNLKGHK